MMVLSEVVQMTFSLTALLQDNRALLLWIKVVTVLLQPLKTLIQLTSISNVRMPKVAKSQPLLPKIFL